MDSEKLPEGIFMREKYRGFTIDIGYDTDPIDPRECDNLGIMLSCDRKLSLDGKIDERYDTYHDMLEGLKEEYNPMVILPLMLHEHSGMKLYVGTKGDLWDSRLAGFCLTNEDMLKRLGVETRDPELLEKYLRDEVITYNAYLNGQVYFYEVKDSMGEGAGTCGGYYEIEHALAEAKRDVEYYIRSYTYRHLKRLKGYIRNRVSIIYRKPFILKH